MAYQEEPPVEGAPEWITTFVDMVSLLVTFFILLLTYNALDANEVFPVLGLNSGSRGTIEHEMGHSLVDPPDDDLMSSIDAARGASVPHTRPLSELVDNIEEMGQKQREGDLEIDLAAAVDGLVLHFGERATFAPGSAEPSEYLARGLRELGRVLEAYPLLVVVEGYTDDRFQPTPRHPTAEALGCARAAAAAQELVRESALEPSLVQVAGLGAARPLNAGETPSERAANRRVQVRVLSLSAARLRALGVEREEGGR